MKLLSATAARTLPRKGLQYNIVDYQLGKKNPYVFIRLVGEGLPSAVEGEQMSGLLTSRLLQTSCNPMSCAEFRSFVRRYALFCALCLFITQSPRQCPGLCGLIDMYVAADAYRVNWNLRLMPKSCVRVG